MALTACFPALELLELNCFAHYWLNVMKRSFRFLITLLVLFPLLAGCSETVDPALESVQLSLKDGTPEAIGVFDLLNSPDTTFEVLDIDAKLNRRAARNLIDHRNGADGVFQTGDDNLFRTVEQVDDVSYVGPAAIAALVAYAYELGWVPAEDDVLGIWDGVSFTADQAAGTLVLANEASREALDDDLGLDRRAVNSIIAARPIPSVEVLSGLYYVGRSALTILRDASGVGPVVELGIISDLDKTIIPSHSGDLPAAPYDDVAALMQALEFGLSGQAGDMYYVTARSADRIDGIPEWLAEHGLPEGPISTGISGMPWIAQPEKVKDISEILDANPDQQFVLFGDSSHRDPEVYREIIQLYPDRIRGAFIHRVNNVNPDRLVTLHGYDDYAELSILLAEMGILQ